LHTRTSDGYYYRVGFSLCRAHAVRRRYCRSHSARARTLWKRFVLQLASFPVKSLQTHQHTPQRGKRKRDGIRRICVYPRRRLPKTRRVLSPSSSLPSDFLSTVARQVTRLSTEQRTCITLVRHSRWSAFLIIFLFFFLLMVFTRFARHV